MLKPKVPSGFFYLVPLMVLALNAYVWTNKIVSSYCSTKAIRNTPVSRQNSDYPLFFFLPGSMLKFPSASSKAARLADGLPSALL